MQLLLQHLLRFILAFLGKLDHQTRPAHECSLLDGEDLVDPLDLDAVSLLLHRLHGFLVCRLQAAGAAKPSVESNRWQVLHVLFDDATRYIFARRIP